MPSNTALSYQMMIEGTVLGAMTRAADNGNYYIASAWGRAYAEFLGIDKKKLPDEPTHITTRAGFVSAWETYFFKIISVIFTYAREKLEQVRREYRKNQDIPSM